MGKKAFSPQTTIYEYYALFLRTVMLNIMQQGKKQFLTSDLAEHACVLNAFGILCQCWRLFDRRIPLDPNNVDKVVQVCCCLHNFLTEDKGLNQIYAELNPERLAPTVGQVRGIMYLPRLNGYRAANDAQGIRDIFRYYFNGPGSNQWQLNRVSFRN